MKPRGPHRVAACAAGVLLALLSGTSAQAHQSSIAYGQLGVTPDRTGVSYQVQISAYDLAEPLGLDQDAPASPAQIEAGRARLLAYATDRIRLESEPAMTCTVAETNVQALSDGAGQWARVGWVWRCPQPITALTLDYDLFFDLDPNHVSPLRARYRDEEASVVLTDSENRFAWQLTDPPPSGFAGFLRSGVDHILSGFDHILFLISLLLVAVIERGPRRYALRGPRSGLRYALTLVTSFTLAHSITLVCAALGFIPIPARAVESCIAISIVYVAVEDMFRPEAPRRYLVTFAFGLVHGMGFASVLRELLPTEGLLVPVLSFNLGVEVGQMLVVAAVLPILFATARLLGADRYRRQVLPVACGLVAILGSLWLIERVLAIQILPFG